jgi:hypothetical protein
MAGYSGTPLAGKLGIKPGTRLCARNAPANYDELLAPLPDGVTRTTRVDDSTQVLHVFITRRSDLHAALAAANERLADDAAIWVSWPKKASKRPTDITEDTIRDEALPLGYVDIKVCAIDAIWSGLKLVRRKELRAQKPARKATRR